jgi:hypothetical protein
VKEAKTYHYPNQIRAPLPNPVQDAKKQVFLNRHYVPPKPEDNSSEQKDHSEP